MKNQKKKDSDYQKSHTIQAKYIKDTVIQELDKNPLLTAKPLCFLLKLNYEQHGDYVAHIRSNWKSDYRYRQGLKGLISIHNWHGWIYTPGALSLDEGVSKSALEQGWVQTRARNRYLLWKDRALGRLEWFGTGRVNIWLKKPVTLGKLKQLLANAFLWAFTSNSEGSRLVDSVNLFERWVATHKRKGFHFVFDTGQRMPYSKIDLFKDSNGVVFKTGDLSHPTCIELEINYPDWGVRLEKLTEQNIKTIEKFGEFMQGLTQPKPLNSNDKSIV